jgi:uncharacterized membrane protein HdeD (DUF308 family)
MGTASALASWLWAQTFVYCAINKNKGNENMTTAVQTQENESPWWLVLLGGIAAIIIGIMLWSNPLKVANVLVWAIGLYWLITGIIYLVSLIWDRRQWGWKLFGGIIGIFAGWFLIDAGAIERVASMGFAVVLVLAIQGIIMGIMGLIAAFQGGGWGAGILGVVSIFIGFLLLGNMWAAALVLPWVVGMFAIIGGIFAIVAAFRMR